MRLLTVMIEKEPELLELFVWFSFACFWKNWGISYGTGVQRIGFSADGLPGHLMCVLICGFIYPCQKDILKFRLKKGIFHLKPQLATKIQAKPRPQMFRNRKLRWKLHFKSYQNRKPHLELDCKEPQTATCKHTPPLLWSDGGIWGICGTGHYE